MLAENSLKMARLGPNHIIRIIGTQCWQRTTCPGLSRPHLAQEVLSTHNHVIQITCSDTGREQLALARSEDMHVMIQAALHHAQPRLQREAQAHDAPRDADVVLPVRAGLV